MNSQTNRAAIVPYPTRVPINAKCKGVYVNQLDCCWLFSLLRLLRLEGILLGTKTCLLFFVSSNGAGAFIHEVATMPKWRDGRDEPTSWASFDWKVSYFCVGWSSRVLLGKQLVLWARYFSYKLGFDEEKDYGISNMPILEKAIEKGYKLTDLSCGEHHTLAAFCLSNSE